MLSETAVLYIQYRRITTILEQIINETYTSKQGCDFCIHIDRHLPVLDHLGISSFDPLLSPLLEGSSTKCKDHIADVGSWKFQYLLLGIWKSFEGDAILLVCGIIQEIFNIEAFE